MNWFQRFFTNPNMHAIASALASPAQAIAFTLGHPEVAFAISTLGAATGLIAAATPENPTLIAVPAAAVPVPGMAAGGPVIHLPPAANGGSYHAQDWINFAGALAAQFAPQVPVAVTPIASVAVPK